MTTLDDLGGGGRLTSAQCRKQRCTDNASHREETGDKPDDANSQ